MYSLYQQKAGLFLRSYQNNLIENLAVEKLM
jgi:hypothetical protein